jgi:hypothetical protein
MKGLIIIGIMSTLFVLPVPSVAQGKAATGSAPKQEQPPTRQRDGDERKAKETDTKKQDHEKQKEERKPDDVMMKLPNPCNDDPPPSWCK